LRARDWFFPFGRGSRSHRGEIAVRIIRTLAEARIADAVVYQEVDAQSRRLWMRISCRDFGANRQCRPISIATRSSRQRYPSVLERSTRLWVFQKMQLSRCGVEERPCFCWPVAGGNRTDGDKIRARNFVARNGFPVAPSAIEEDDPATFCNRARTIGAPLLVKPSAGAEARACDRRISPSWTMP